MRLKGARDVFYRPIFITLAPSEDGYLSDGVELSEGIAVCETAGADVVGISLDGFRGNSNDIRSSSFAYSYTFR